MIQECKLDVFGNIEFVNQVEALEDEADVLLANVASLRFRVARHILVEEEKVPV